MVRNYGEKKRKKKGVKGGRERVLSLSRAVQVLVANKYSVFVRLIIIPVHTQSSQHTITQINTGPGIIKSLTGEYLRLVLVNCTWWLSLPSPVAKTIVKRLCFAISVSFNFKLDSNMDSCIYGEDK